MHLVEHDDGRREHVNTLELWPGNAGPEVKP